MLESARLPHAFARATSAGPARIPRIPSVPHILPVPHIPSVPLVFNDSMDTANMANVLLIDSTLADKQVFYDSANANTFPIIYNSTSKTDELLALFRRKFPGSSIQRISLAFHGRGGNFMARFMNNKALFEEGDLAENQTSFSDNVTFLIGCIKEFHVSYIDFLACNTLQYSNWKSYYGLLAIQTSVVVGASNDATGNIKYGGDWVMESNGEDIKQIYFTDGIDYYKYLLDEITIDGIIYSYTPGVDNPASVTGFVPPITTANIPSTIDISGNIYNVTSIGDYAFQNCSALTSLTIPNSVTIIGDGAFESCSILTSVTIGSSVTSIGDGAFYNCSALTSVSIPDSVTIIGDGAFESCSILTSVTIGSSVTTIGDGAFYDCTSLTSVTIGSSVETIGDYAFYNCSALTSVSIPNSVTSIGFVAFAICSSLTSVTIPDSVTSIGDYAFALCSALTAINVDASNNNYSSDAFGVLFNKLKTTLIQYPIGNTQTTYTIPDSVTTIGGYAFAFCSSLTSVTIGSSVTIIGYFAFEFCSALTSVTIPDSVTSIGYIAFQGCSSLTAFVVDASNNNYSSDAGVLFNKLQTTLIQYPIGNTQTSYTIPDSVTNIENSAFAFCSALTAINVDGGNLDYSSDAFGVLFNNNQTYLIQYPIGNTRTSYTIPSSVTYIYDYAFALCSSLTAINIDAGNLNYSSDSGVLFNSNKTGLIQYPIGNTQTSYTIPSCETYIYDYAIARCSALTSVTIPSSVTNIASYVFENCANLNLVYFLQTPTLPSFQLYTFTGISESSVGKYYSSVTNSSVIAPYFNSISEISNTIPTLTSITPFTSTSTSAVVTISYANLVTNGNEVVDNNPYVFLVNAVSSGSLSIGATQGTATPWNASTNYIINESNNAYWSPPPGGVNGLLNAFSVVVQDAVGEVSSPNVDVQVNVPYPCFLEGTKILCFKNNQEVYCPVESLQKGDLVKTIYNGYMPICMMGTKSIYNPGNDYRVTNRLYKCPKEKYPTLFEDLYITGCHSILVPWMTNDQWENTKAVNGNIYVTDNHFRLIACADEKAEPYNKEGYMNIYHIALDHHDICMNYGIYANGLLVESCSIEYLIKYSNLKISSQSDSAISDDFVQVSNNMTRQLVDTY